MLTETLGWMTETVEEFGLGALDVRLLIEWMKADLGSSNAGVRNGAIALLGAMHRQLGPGLAPMLSQHVKPALMTTLDATFKANPAVQARTCAAHARCTGGAPRPQHLLWFWHLQSSDGMDRTGTSAC